MCSGRVDPLFVLEAFKNGADAVMVGGCKLGECKYMDGNFQALIMAEMVKNLLRLIGIKEERFTLEWVSSAEPAKLVEDMKKFMLKVKELGPLGSAEGLSEGDLNFYLDSAIAVCKNMQVRTTYGNIAKELKKLQDFSEETIKQRVEEKLLPQLRGRLYEIEVKTLIQDGPKSLDYLVSKTKASVDELNPILSKLMKT
ncbi:methyl-viologen-reducing hydrogenase subunit delta [Caldimicrobium thiodismutans]|jgi:coenzyme F420-reducing hydrogenase delta subunit|uniref:Methyl-viologen-reducing hydrogenase subunit delta n=1 Tax=Caldimicrobium thiodismutans TaxID=1653476 RepID=A0A0U5BZ73_9BACT|nr:methyl-viologen-reducing hydrogenase subunit delta [Caldimicrobium thiodismutans]